MQEVLITRGNIPVSSVDAAYMIAPKVGFIRLNKFAERTYEEFMVELEKLQAQKMENLILDLRGNTGGLMKEAVDMADEFLSDNKLIVYTEGENTPRAEFTAKRPGLFEKGKLVVLIDETSASASEILAGALQDWDRATIMGRRSFGKGLVQQQFQLSDGSAVRLTVARYFTPLGRNIQKSYADGIDKYNDELMGRFHSTDSIVKKDSIARTTKKFKTPLGKVVFGGGGITPDTTVLFDSTLYTRSVLQVLMTSTLNDFAYYDYVNNRSQYAIYKSPIEFNNQFTVTDEQWKRFINFAAKEQLTFNAIDQRSKDFILNRIKALIARQIWRSNGYFAVANNADVLVLKAVKLVQ
jgi:carboxyl-terminal processing protease